MKLISTRGPLSSPSLLQGAVLKYMMTGPENGTQRQALLRVIAAILHFSPPETQQSAWPSQQVQRLLLLLPRRRARF